MGRMRMIGGELMRMSDRRADLEAGKGYRRLEAGAEVVAA